MENKLGALAPEGRRAMHRQSRTTCRCTPFPTNREQYRRREADKDNTIPHDRMMRADSKRINSASNKLTNQPMPQTNAPTSNATVRKATAADLAVGQICADRDGNRIRIDHFEAGKLSYHFLNDELRVQEGIRETSIEKFLSEGWYISTVDSL
jgi:hypothetical protein